MNVTQATKDAYKNNNVKHLNVKLIKRQLADNDPIEYEVPESKIVADSFSLTEAVMESGTFLVSGCIAREMSIELAMIDSTTQRYYFGDTYGLLIEVSLSIDGTGTDDIPLFKGHVASIDRPKSRDIFVLKAYDDFYEYSGKNLRLENLISQVEDEIGITYPCTFRELWDGIFDILFEKYLDGDKEAQRSETIPNVSATLTDSWDDLVFPMDNITIDFTEEPLNDSDDGSYWFRSYLNIKLTIFDLISYFCQVNGVMAIIDRSNKLTFRYADSWKSNENAEVVQYYKSVYIGNYNEKPKSLIIQNSSQEAVYSENVKTGTNLYTISGNAVVDTMLTDTTSADSVLDMIGDECKARKYNISTYGMPWLEVGIDKINFNVYSAVTGTTVNVFPLYKRTLSGIQNLTDTFVYDVDTDFDKMTRSLQRQIKDLDAAKPNAKYVTSTPTDFENNTIYFVRKS